MLRISCSLNQGSVPNTRHVTVVGGGAAGLSAAFFAAKHGAKVTVLERMEEAGKKVLMSGGSRCNVLPVEVDLSRDFFSESSPSALRAVFSTWTLEQCKAWLEDSKHGIGLELVEEPQSRKYFPKSNSSKEVRNKLVAACLRLGVTFQYEASCEALEWQPSTADALDQAQSTATIEEAEEKLAVASTSSSSSGMSKRKKGRDSSVSGRSVGSKSGTGNQGQWRVRLKGGATHEAETLVLATGGMSFPIVGTDGTGHRLLKQLGHRLMEPYPALTPLVGSHPGGHMLAGLSLYNVSLECQVGKSKKNAHRSQRSGLLFTHRGFSGPSILDLSHHAVVALTRQQPVPPLRVSWTGEDSEVWEARLRTAATQPGASTALVHNMLSRSSTLPDRLAGALCAELGIGDRQLCQLRREEREALVLALSAYELRCDGHEGYKKAEVTGGGVPLQELNCDTMASRVLPQMHICGELVDVFGRIGGFNFYWAWLSGRLAGIAAASSC